MVVDTAVYGSRQEWLIKLPELRDPLLVWARRVNYGCGYSSLSYSSGMVDKAYQSMGSTVGFS